jgi:hypothetical protein
MDNDFIAEWLERASKDLDGLWRDIRDGKTPEVMRERIAFMKGELHVLTTLLKKQGYK